MAHCETVRRVVTQTYPMTTNNVRVDVTMTAAIELGWPELQDIGSFFLSLAAGMMPPPELVDEETAQPPETPADD